MLRIKNVSARNFLSIGSQTQAVNFDDAHLTLVLGHNADLGGVGARNGVGKTTIINALSYALYGEALTNIKRDNLINLTNGKNMMTTVDFEVNGKEYRIERGRKPNILRFLIDGVEVQHDDAQGDSRETQKEISRLIGFPHEMFKHIVALNTYTEPFLSMKANDQRAMIEQLLGITDLSAKADILKELVRETRDKIREEELNINAINASNERIKKNITEIERRETQWHIQHQQKLTDMETALTELSAMDIAQEITRHRENVTIVAICDRIAVLTKEKRRLNESVTRSTERLTELTDSLEEARNGLCPSCGQGTAHLDTHEAYMEKITTKVLKEQEHLETLKAQHADVISELTDLKECQDPHETFYDTLEQALEHKHNLDALAVQYAEKSEDTNPYTEQVKTLSDTGLQEVDFDQINQYTQLREHQEFLFKLLTSKDSFIRKKIIDQNIAYLNHRLSYYLEKIGLPHEVKFSNDLTTEITEYGRELNFDNLSRGERNRLILSLSWAFRDIFESLNQPMNLMCIDELIDSGLDTMGVENALSILKKMSRDSNKNIFLISHREELMGRVNNVLTVVKEGGFTSYSTSAEYVA